MPSVEQEQPGLSSDSDILSLTVDVDSLTECDDGMASNRSSPTRYRRPNGSPEPSARPRQDMSKDGADGNKVSWSQPFGSLKQRTGRGDYLVKAGEQIKLALQKEAEQDYESAFHFYQIGVDFLLQGVQGEFVKSSDHAGFLIIQYTYTKRITLTFFLYSVFLHLKIL